MPISYSGIIPVLYSGDERSIRSVGFNIMTKTCKQCEVEKSLDDFYPGRQRGKSGQVWTYHDSLCKICRNDYQSERRRQIKRLAVEYLGGECQDCGLVDDSVVYDFHHLDPEQKDFSIGKQAKAFETIKTELDKCVLLCSNCHRKRHK